MSGGSSNVKVYTPKEEKNTLHGTQYAHVLDIIGYGPIHGFVNGDDLLKSYHLQDTPVQNQDGTFNHFDVDVYVAKGTQDQSYLPGFDRQANTEPVGVEVKYGEPIIRTVTNTLVTSLRVTAMIPALVHTKENGDRVKTNVAMRVQLIKEGFIYDQRYRSLNEKGNAPFYMDFEFPKVPEAPFEIKFIRETPDSDTDRLVNKTNFASYVEFIDVKLSYPNIAVIGSKFNATTFSGSLPNRNFYLYGRIVLIPTTYDPWTRTYKEGVWDGSFKESWTNNPAWILYDLATNDLGGVGEHIRSADINLQTFYEISKFCDEMVDDGYGGKEPRVVFNAYLYEAKKAVDIFNAIASSFFGKPIWDGDMLSATLDKPTDPVHIYNNTNVVDGAFNYSHVGRSAIKTVIQVSYQDERNMYRKGYVVVSDDEMVRKYGRRVESVEAVGCTSRGQAMRYGRYLLETARTERESVTFTTGREGLKNDPFDVIQIADSNYTGIISGGRILESNGAQVTLDYGPKNIEGGKIAFLDGNATYQEYDIIAQEGELLTLDREVGDISSLQAWAIRPSGARKKLYRAVSIKENSDEGTFTISAIEHNPNKLQNIADGITIDPEEETIWTAFPRIDSATLGRDGNDIIVQWQNRTNDTSRLSYVITLYRDGSLYRVYESIEEERFVIPDQLPMGGYRITIQAVNAREQLSNTLTLTMTLQHQIKGLYATPDLRAVRISWILPEFIDNEIKTELWIGVSNDVEKAQKLATLPYPQSDFTLGNLNLKDEYYFWVRLVDRNDRAGEFSDPVFGHADRSGEGIGEIVDDMFENSAIGQDIRDRLIGDITDSVMVDLDDDVKEIIDKSEVIESIRETVGSIGGEIALLRLSSVHADQAQMAQTLIVKAETDLNSAELALQQLSEATKTRATAKNIVALTAEMGDVRASFRRLEEVTVTELEALAQVIEQLKVEIGDDLSATITELKEVIADVDGNVKALVTIKAETMVDGRKVASGFSFGASEEESMFTIFGDRFAVATQKGDEIITPFQIITDESGSRIILDADLISNQTLQGNKLIGATIQGGSLNIGDGLFKVSEDGSVEIKASKDGRGGLNVFSNRLDVVDDDGDLMTRVGLLNP